ncbi:MAG TPA: transglutaminase domain-containing protein [bacterium]|jgi:hypothetical protein
MIARRRITIAAALVVAAALVLVGCASPQAGAPGPPPAGAPLGARGPGMKPMNLADLPLPVPRTFELTHVTPAAFAQALGKDVTRIFEFVRDNIAFEAYSGVLRGPRGTLLAMAGNSADRATLLAALLTESGYQVRFAKGTLSRRDAQELVSSIWAPLPRLPGQNKTATDVAKTAVQAFVRSGKREFGRIQDALKQATPDATQVGPAFDTLVAETLTHYWVQVAKDGGWIDLDPSFADSAVGGAHATADETMETLPANLYHRVTLRVVADVSDGTSARTEELVTYSANAADLSGVDIVLVHVPENWTGPVRNIQGALSSAMSDTGRFKPVLLRAGAAPIIGAPLTMEVQTSGAPGVINILKGQGTRHAAEIAVAERIEFTFDSPDRRRDGAVRDVFDSLGAARRAAGRALTPEEVSALATTSRRDLVTPRFLSIFITTGRLDAAHLVGASAASSPAQGARPGASPMPLRRLAVTYQVMSDMLLARLGSPDKAIVSFYPVSPRVFIAEFSAQGKRFRLAVDLRRDRARAVARSADAQFVFRANVMRGVVDGTLERMVIDYVAAQIPGTVDLKTGLNTSQLFQIADDQRVSDVLVTSDQARLDPAVSQDAVSRLLDDIRNGNYAVAPQRPVRVNDESRYAWWSVNPHSGETIAVADDGLHQAGTEYVVDNGDGTFDVWVEAESGQGAFPVAEGIGIDALADLVFEALLEGIEVLGPL